MCAQDAAAGILGFLSPSSSCDLGFVGVFFLLMISSLGAEGTRRQVLGVWGFFRIWGWGDQLLSSDVRLASLAPVGH